MGVKWEMREFKDDKTGLTWVACDRGLGYSVTNPVDEKMVKEHINAINQWKSDNISRFIAWDEPGEYLSHGELQEDLYFAYDSGKFAGVSVIETGIDVMYEKLFNQHIENIQRDFTLEDKYMSLVTAKKVLRSANHDNSTNIEFVVVSPDHQGNGVGTRMVRSITNNTEFFTNNDYNSVISAKAHYTNKASIKMFQKCDYERISAELDARFHSFYYVK